MPDVIVSNDIDAFLKTANDAAARAELGVAIGTDVQAHSAALDAVTGTNTGDQDLSGLEPIQTPASQAEAEAGTEAGLRSFSPLRVKQAIDALGGGGGGGGSSIVQSFVDNAFVVNKPTASNVIVSVTGLQYTMESGKTYYVKMFYNHKGGQMSGGASNEYVTLDHTPWSVTAGVEEGFMGMNYVEQIAGSSAGGYFGWQSDYTAQDTHDADASTGLANYFGFQPYVGFVGIEGFITAPSTAAFTPTLTYTGNGTGTLTGSFQGMIMEMP